MFYLECVIKWENIKLIDLIISLLLFKLYWDLCSFKDYNWLIEGRKVDYLFVRVFNDILLYYLLNVVDVICSCKFDFR